MSFTVLLAQISGKANSAADFLSRVQTDPTLTLSLKLIDQIPIQEIEMETEAKDRMSLYLIFRVDKSFLKFF